MRRFLWLNIFIHSLLASFLSSVVFAQYNPLYESQLEAVEKQLPPPSTGNNNTPLKHSGDIQFDPDKGIILPDNDVPSETNPNLNPKTKEEDFLLMKIDKTNTNTTESTPPPDDNRAYIDRQMDKQFDEVKSYSKEVGQSYKKVFSWLLDKILWVLRIIKEWPVVKDPPPVFLRILRNSSSPLKSIPFIKTSPLVNIAQTANVTISFLSGFTLNLAPLSFPTPSITIVLFDVLLTFAPIKFKK